MRTLIIGLSIILVLFMIYVGLFASKRKMFNNEKYVTIFKDFASILLIPLLTNVLSDNKLTPCQFDAYVVLIIVLIGLYLVADWLFVPSEANLINKVVVNNKPNSYSFVNILHIFEIIIAILFFWALIFIIPIIMMILIIIRIFTGKKIH
ncbi:hypothetical protein [uncultured Lactobacillus sp.]|uniref:hypothetical protein n=1 Tax=uncultured Lactobacillus sp. TaxID=153152 RepID=UPI00259B81BD|nr:hypothetical protein [uncultured Lactobacillus sp.]